MWIELKTQAGLAIAVNTEKVALVEEHPRAGYVHLVGAGYKEVVQGSVEEVLNAILNAGEAEFLGDEVAQDERG